MELYQNIKKYRLERNMSQNDLAKRAGYTDRSSIAKIENGDVDLPQSKIMLIAKALGVDAGTLMGEVEAAPAVTLRPDESSLLSDYNRLNPLGRDEASKRVKELTQIESYIKDTGSQSA